MLEAAVLALGSHAWSGHANFSIPLESQSTVGYQYYSVPEWWNGRRAGLKIR
jgi:hypothetical protein